MGLISDLCNRLVIGSMDIVRDELIPVGNRLNRSGVLVEDINLLKRETLGLGHAEVGEDEAAQAGRSPDEEHFGAKVAILRIDDVRGGVAVRRVSDTSVNGRVQNHVPNTKVPEPVRGGREGHGLGTDSERVDLAGDDPSNGTPGRCEEGDVDADEGDKALLARLVLHGDGDTDDGDEVLADEHTNGTNQEETTATDMVNSPERGNGHAYVDNGGGDRDREGVGNTGLFEESRTVVEDEVDTGELLPSLQEDTSEGTKEDLVGAVLEAVDVRALAEFLFDS